MDRPPRDTMRTGRRVIRCAAALLVVLTLHGLADYPSPEAAGFHHCALIYDRDQRTSRDLAPYVAEVVAGAPRAWLFDAFLFLITRTPSGRSTMKGRAQREDWQYHLDRWFSPNRDLAALDTAIANATPVLGAPPGKRRVMLSIPRPDRRTTDFGDVDGDGRSEDLSTDAGLRVVLSWYVDEARRCFAAAGSAHLELWGFYWMHETIPADDEAMSRAAAAIVHESGHRLLWIPWFRARGWDRWQACGIDVAIMQPNYAFFSKHQGRIKRGRLALNAGLARSHGMGVEIELPMFCNHPATAFYFRRYLADGAAERHGYQHAATAYYLGRDNLDRLCYSKERWQRELYAALADYVRGEAVPDPDLACEWRDQGRPVGQLRDGSILDRREFRSVETELPAPTQVEAVDVYIHDLESKHGWTGRIVVEAREGDGGPWQPGGWALSAGNGPSAGTPQVVSVPVRTTARGFRVSLQPAAGSGVARIGEIILDCCPSEQVGRTGTHKALNAPYTVTPAVGEATYGDSGHELTDGVVPETGFASGGTVGWYGGRATVTFDLGTVVPVDRVEAHVGGGGYAAVNWPASAVLKADVSRRPPSVMAGTGAAPEGFSWLPARPLVVDLQRSADAANGHLTFLPERPIQARYLALDFAANGWLMVSEIRILSDDRNIAPGADYSLRPAPTVAAQDAYPDDGVRLTDGRIADGFSQTLLTGWHDEEPRTFTVSLPAATEVSAVTAWTLAGGKYAIRAPARVTAELSTDGERWRRVGEALRPDGLEEREGGEFSALPYRISAPPTAATTVRVTVRRSSGWTMLSEIQVD